ncbi:hypothetical protein [Mycobacterium sp. 852014-52144_SCH5372336]|uniref:hypothetical protein n=1 Tax=Mycobacterium sp. 852014-52144_SCH5372336 TaxID=1834115 RepID=UPI0007FE4467|nr:hypothetical protein [Mycobacterium sp. 852014-52144_SCH5372336]OBB71570.1 hypothetical protein A5759_20565 [Mycobacterium sp. 852014-52144_SCH5372336]
MTSKTGNFEAAVGAAIELVETEGAITFMRLADRVDDRFGIEIHGDKTMTIGNHTVGDGTTMTTVADPTNVVLWNGAAPQFLELVEAVLAERHVVLERTTVEHYRLSGMELLEDYSDDGHEEVPLPAIDFGDDLGVDGYEVPTWLPVMFAWTNEPSQEEGAGRL